jgi:hypothetical protein
LFFCLFMSFARSFATDPKSRSFDLTRIPTLSKMVLTDFYAKEDPDMINKILAWLYVGAAKIWAYRQFPLPVCMVFLCCCPRKCVLWVGNDLNQCIRQTADF